MELATRITTQRLHYRTGDEEAAALSVSAVFGTARKLMARHLKAIRFNCIALRLLNGVLRPYSTRWDGWMTEDIGTDGKIISKFRDEWVRRKFREELRELQPLVYGYLKALKAISQTEAVDPRWLELGKHAELLEDIRKECETSASPAYLGEATELKIRAQVILRKAGPEGRQITKVHEDIQNTESNSIRERRAKLPLPAGRLHPSDSGGYLINPLGLALSGGGIRSATFCLGILQALQQKKLFPQFDYLSTVSGGGYLGTFLSSYLGVDSATLDKVEVRVETNKWKTPEEVENAVSPAPASSTATGGAESAPAQAPARSDGRDPASRIEAALGTAGKDLAESVALRHLRNHSRYLMNGGVWALIKIAGVLATGFITSLLMILTLPLLAAWLLLLARLPVFSYFWHIGLIWAMWLLVICWFFMPLVQRRAQGARWDSTPTRWRSIVENLTVVLAIFCFIAAGFVFGPKMVDRYEELTVWLTSLLRNWKIVAPPESFSVFFAGAMPVIFGLLSKRRDGSVRMWAKWFFTLTAPAFFLLAFLVFASHLGIGEPDLFGQPISYGGVADDVTGKLTKHIHPWNLRWAGLATFLALVWAWLFLNINTFAPHRYYRNRLCECYLAMNGRQQRTWLKRKTDRFFHGLPDEGATEDIKGVGTLHRVPLTAMGSNPAAPYHLINATLNAEASKDPSLRGRNGDFFLFSQNYCGSPLTGYVRTEVQECADPHVDLGTAMAISGAAASTNMGWKTLRRMRFLLTLFNVRLGYWMRRPGHPGWGKNGKWLEGPGPYYFIREMFGGVHEKTGYVNLSDGGHLENLAVYELLRRQCKFIVCVDAGMEPKMECADLMRLQRYAAIDFGIRMYFDPSDLTLLPTTYSRAYAVLVKIDYAPEQRGDNQETSDHLGWMLYIKLAVTGTEPHYVLDYRRENPAFPHQTTGDQLYDEAQFEAYRALGDCAANSLFRKEITGGEDPQTVEDWFQQLANSLLPDNDEVFDKQ